MNKLTSAWNRFWFSEAPYFDLAFLRIMAVAFQCFYLLNQQFAMVDYVSGLPHEMYRPLYVLWPFIWPWGTATPPDVQIVWAVYWATVLFGFTSLLGLMTNVSMFFFAIGNILVQAFVFSFGDFHHPEAIMMLALLVIALGPCGKVLSLDSWLRRGNAPTVMTPLLEASSPYAGWPVKFLQCLFPLLYISAAVAKIFPDFTLDWANGFTLQYYFIQDHIRKDSPLAMWASQFHIFIYLSQLIVLAFQLTYFLIIPYKKLRWIYLPLGLIFHLANYLILKAPFPQWMILLLGAYVPWSVAFRMLADKRVPIERTA